MPTFATRVLRFRTCCNVNIFAKVEGEFINIHRKDADAKAEVWKQYPEYVFHRIASRYVHSRYMEQEAQTDGKQSF